MVQYFVLIIKNVLISVKIKIKKLSKSVIRYLEMENNVVR